MTRALPLFFVALLAGCPAGPTAPTDGGPAICLSADDCNDGIDCTFDRCDVTNHCAHDALSELCAAGETCDPRFGCRTGRTCANDADCADAIDCTLDTCMAGGLCQATPIAARCPAATPICDPILGCVAPSGCGSDLECDDGVDCTLDACGVDRNCTHDPIDARCAPGETCGLDGCITPMPCTTAADCQDGDFCNGAEVCVPEFGCAPAAMPRMCADTDDCTVDTCDATANACVFACDRSRPECSCPVPPTSCTGTFDLVATDGPLTFSCYIGRTGFDFSAVTFGFDVGDLVVTPSRLYTPGIVGASLTDAEDPRCPDFDATVVLAGGCEEHYRLYGTFTDDDHFTGTLEWSYVKLDGFSCTVSACMGTRTRSVMGTRR